MHNPNFFFSHIPGLPTSSTWHSHCLSEDGWRKAEGRGGDRRGKGRGWMCCSVLLNVLTCMKEEAFILGLSRGCAQIWNTHARRHARTHDTHTHTHTHTYRFGKWELTSPEISLTYLYINLVFESCWKDVFLSGSETSPYTWILQIHYTLPNTHPPTPHTHTHTHTYTDNTHKHTHTKIRANKEEKHMNHKRQGETVEKAEKANKKRTAHLSATHRTISVHAVVSYCVSIATMLLSCRSCCHGNKVTGMLICQKGFILGWHHFQCCMRQACMCVCMYDCVCVCECVYTVRYTKIDWEAESGNLFAWVKFHISDKLCFISWKRGHISKSNPIAIRVKILEIFTWLKKKKKKPLPSFRQSQASLLQHLHCDTCTPSLGNSPQGIPLSDHKSMSNRERRNGQKVKVKCCVYA